MELTEKEKAIKEYFNEHKKTYSNGVGATLIFGPIGLFYTNWIAGLFLTIILILVHPYFSAMPEYAFYHILVLWPLSILLSIGYVSTHNKKLMSKIKLNNALSI